MPSVAVVNIVSGTGPHPHLRTVLGNLQSLEGTGYVHIVAVDIYFVQRIHHQLALLHGGIGLFFFFAQIYSNCVILSLLVFQNQRRTSGQSAGSYDGKFQSAFRSIGPTLCFFDWRINQIERRRVQTNFTLCVGQFHILQLVHLMAIQAAAGQSIIIFFFQFFNDASGPGFIDKFRTV